MVTSIDSQARQHLLDFMQKLLHGRHTQGELENFAIMQYQNTDLEEIRATVLKKMLLPTGSLKEKIDSEADRMFVRDLVIALNQLTAS